MMAHKWSKIPKDFIEFQKELKGFELTLTGILDGFRRFPGKTAAKVQTVVENGYQELVQGVSAVTHVVSGDLSSSWEIQRQSVQGPEGFHLKYAIVSPLEYASTEVSRKGIKTSSSGSGKGTLHNPFEAYRAVDARGLSADQRVKEISKEVRKLVFEAFLDTVRHRKTRPGLPGLRALGRD